MADGKGQQAAKDHRQGERTAILDVGKSASEDSAKNDDAGNAAAHDPGPHGNALQHIADGQLLAFVGVDGSSDFEAAIQPWMKSAGLTPRGGF